MTSTLGSPSPTKATRFADRVPPLDVAFVPGLIVLLCVALSLASPYFLNTRNFGQILIGSAVLGIAAAGATFVIIAGDLDLSVGYNVALSGVVTALVATRTDSWQVGAVAGLGAGVAMGLVNGFLTTALNVPSFVATLGTGTVAGGLALHLTGGSTISGLPDGFGALATTTILGLQSMVWIMLLIFLIGGIVLHRTNFGVKVFSVGGNKQAAYLSGVSVSSVRVSSFAIAGLCGGIAGVLLTSGSRLVSPESVRA